MHTSFQDTWGNPSVSTAGPPVTQTSVLSESDSDDEIPLADERGSSRAMQEAQQLEQQRMAAAMGSQRGSVDEDAQIAIAPGPADGSGMEDEHTLREREREREYELQRRGGVGVGCSWSSGRRRHGFPGGKGGGETRDVDGRTMIQVPYFRQFSAIVEAWEWRKQKG